MLRPHSKPHPCACMHVCTYNRIFVCCDWSASVGEVCSAHSKRVVALVCIANKQGGLLHIRKKIAQHWYKGDFFR